MNELKLFLELYKDALGDEKLEVAEEERAKVEEGQVRIFLWQPWEYVLVAGEHERGLYEIVPLTLTKLTTASINLIVKGLVFKPLPFSVYAREEILEKESILFAKVSKGAVEETLKSMRWAVLKPSDRYKREFIRLVWQRFRDLTLSSIIYTEIRQEQEQVLEGVTVKLSEFVVEKLIKTYGIYQLAAEGKKYLKGPNWYGVVEEGKLVLYLPVDLVGRKVRIKLFEDTVYEGQASERIILENLPSLPDYEPLEEKIHVEIQD